MRKLEFNSNNRPTLGVEIELGLVGADMSLAPAVTDLLGELPAGSPYFKPELMRSCIELNTDVCETVEALDREAKEFLHAIHEANGYQPTLPSIPEQAPPASSAPTNGRDTAGKTSASSTNTPGAPTVGALAEGVTALPALGAGGANGSDGSESQFSRVAAYRANRRSR